MYKETNIKDVTITGGLLHEKRMLAAGKTIPYIRKALNDEIEGIEPSGAFENFRIAAGESDRDFYGLVSQDSDVYKWMEAAALALQYENQETLAAFDEARGSFKESAAKKRIFKYILYYSWFEGQMALSERVLPVILCRPFNRSGGIGASSAGTDGFTGDSRSVCGLY